MKKGPLYFLFPVLSLLFITDLNAKPSYNHWSFNFKAGFNRGEYAGGGISGGKYGFIGGMEIERTFNPLWGLLAEYEYNQYVVSDDKEGFGNEVTMQASINMANLLDETRRGSWQHLNVFFRMGAGLSFYDTEEKGSTIVIPAVLSFEYDLNNYIAIGLTGEHRWHTSSTMGFAKPIQYRPVVWAALMTCRIKLNGVRIDNIRNVELNKYRRLF